ncbi:cytochrome P450 [Reyranella sp.]|uniref:cytochrome P450 n=1 Tax=Reyranella sp. TaxID=1929291 RepID=UPI002723F2D7|nr:cytochrome P450 [Reyranella sp.]MDO8973891.1 cytochrome P450 [Reyranella sp.]
MWACVEVCLRDVSPVQLTKPRFAVRDLVGQGPPIPLWRHACGILEAVNCDPAKFDMPDDRDIARHPNPQLSFGTGAHFCPGFQLARLEMTIAFERILVRFPAIPLAEGKRPIQWRKRLGIRAVAQQPVHLTP